jgi:hypothetical protein
MRTRGTRRASATPPLRIAWIRVQYAGESMGNDNCELDTWTSMKKVSWRARLREGAISLLVLSALVTILFAADFRVRAEATRLATIGSPGDLARGSARLTTNASRLLITARDQTVQHGPLAAFTATAGILLLFMLKT